MRGAAITEPGGTMVVGATTTVDSACPAFESTGYGETEERRGASLPTGLDVVASAREYQDTFHCAPPKSVDLVHHRLAVYRFAHESSDDVRLEYIVEDDGKVRVVLSTSRACQGIAPTTEHSVLAFVLPASHEPVELVFCPQEGPACTGMER